MLSTALTNLDQQGITPVIPSGYRSPDARAVLRNGSDPTVITPARVSWHQAGAAVDIGPNSNAGNFDTIRAAMSQAGFVWGGTFRRQLEEAKVRLATTMFVVGLAACANAQNVSAPESYSVLLKDDGQTWCAYKNSNEFQTEATNLKPTESARITYAAGKLSELTYQVEAGSGDWIVVDRYTPVAGGFNLRRANLLAQEKLQVIQETTVLGSKAEPFHVVNVSTLTDGKKADLPRNLDFPEVPVKTNLSATLFVQVVSEMRGRSLGKLCKKTD